VGSSESKDDEETEAEKLPFREMYDLPELAESAKLDVVDGNFPSGASGDGMVHSVAWEAGKVGFDTELGSRVFLLMG